MLPLGSISAFERAAAPRGLSERTRGPSGLSSSTRPMPHKGLGGRLAAEDMRESREEKERERALRGSVESSAVFKCVLQTRPTTACGGRCLLGWCAGVAEGAAV